MGNTLPSECNGASCCKCGAHLPAMRSFDYLRQEYFPHAGNCYVFFDGIYYRPEGGSHQCKDCFWRPVREEEQRRERERQEREKRERQERERQERENRERQEQLRRQQEEELRKADEAKRRADELERRRREAQEAEIMEKEAEEIRKREEEARQKQMDVNLSRVKTNLQTAQQRQNETKCFEIKMTGQIVTDSVDSERYMRGIEAVDDNDMSDCIEKQKVALDLSELIQSIQPVRDLETEPTTAADSGIEGVPDTENTVNSLLESAIMLCHVFDGFICRQTMTSSETDSKTPIKGIYEVIGQLLSSVGDDDRQSLIVSMHRVASKMNAYSIPDESDKSAETLSTIHVFAILEELILDIDNQDAKWMKAACEQYIELAVPAIVEEDFVSEIIHIMKFLLGTTNGWSERDICNCIKSFTFPFRTNQSKLLNYLTLIRSYALKPAYVVSSVDEENCPITLRHIIDSFEEDKWYLVEKYVHKEETQKTVDEVLSELKIDEVSDIEKQSVKHIIEHANKLTKTYSGRENDGVKSELKRLRESSYEHGEKMAINLAIVSMAVYQHKHYWPLNTQLVSYCLLMMVRKTKVDGRLLQMLTGEGKSCVIAMTAATFAILGKTVDIITSSPVLSQRDADDWAGYYKLLGFATSCNVDANDDETTCYESPIVYGTVGTFARDILKTEFHLKDVRKGRRFEFVIVDEVDSMLIDQGVQCTYLSHSVASTGMRHLEPILTMVWMTVSRFFPTVDESANVMYRPNPEAFFVTLSHLCDDQDSKVDPLQLLKIAEDEALVEKEFTQKFTSGDIEAQKRLLNTVNNDLMAKFFLASELRVPIKVQCYVLNDNGQRIPFRIGEKDCSNTVVKIDPLGIPVLLLDNGLASALLPEDTISAHITELLLSKFTENSAIPKEEQLNIPGYLRDYCRDRLPHWVNNAFLALRMRAGREYVASADEIWPVDFASTGVTERNKKWGDGLQQFIEMKHRLPISPLSVVTNYLSNVEFFSRYKSNVLGVSGTLGSEWDKHFMSKAFSVCFFTVPTYKRRKIFEVDGLILDDRDKWKRCVQNVVSARRFGPRGRAILIICEDIVTAREIFDMIKSEDEMEDIQLGQVKLYNRSDDANSNTIASPMQPGQVVVTTNLGARGTDFPIDKVANSNGGLFVLLTFISLNERVERQAFGRTGRRGAPGSVQIIVNRMTMPLAFQHCETMAEVKRLRDTIEKNHLEEMMATEFVEMRIKQKLFDEYCQLQKRFVSSIQSNRPTHTTDKKIQTETLNEEWSGWLQKVNVTPDSDVDALVKGLNNGLSDSAASAHELTSRNFYHLLNYGGARVMNDDFVGGTEYFDKVISSEPVWSAFALYNRAYCTIKLERDGYIDKALYDLKEAQQKLIAYKENVMCTQQFVGSSAKAVTTTTGESSFDNYMKTTLQILNHVDEQIREAQKKLEEIKGNNRDAIAEPKDICSLVPDADLTTKKALSEFWQLGLLFTFNVKQKPRFCIEGLIVFLIGVLEIVAGALLTAVSVGTLSNIGMALISEGVSDVIAGTQAMITGAFEWASWGISKAISIGTSILSWGIGKLVSRGFSGLKDAVKQTWQEVKGIPKLVRNEFITHGVTQAATSQMKTITQFVVKEGCIQLMNQALTYGEEKLLELMMERVKELMTDYIRQTIQGELKSGKDLHKEICLMYGAVTANKVSNEQRFISIIRDVSQQCVQSCLQNASVHSEVMSKVSEVFGKLKENKDLTSNKWVKLGITGAEIGMITQSMKSASSDIEKLARGFATDFALSIAELRRNEKLQGEMREDAEMLARVTDIFVDTLSETATKLIELKILQPLSAVAQRKINGLISSYIDKHYIGQEQTKEKLREGELAFMIAQKPMHDCFGEPNKKMLDKYCSKVMNVNSEGGIAEARILAEVAKVNIVIQDANNKPIRTISPNANCDTVRLIYHPQSSEYPHGHYDAHVKGTIVKIPADGTKSCLYSALSVCLNARDPKSRTSASQLRQDVVRQIIQHPRKYNEVVGGAEWAAQLKRGHGLLLRGAGGRAKRPRDENVNSDLVEPKLNNVAMYKKNIKHGSQGGQVEHDHVPARDCIEKALKLPHKSPLTVAMAEYLSPSGTATTNVKKPGRDLATVTVPKGAHRLFLSTGSTKEAKAYRHLVVEAMNSGDVVKTLKLCFIGHQSSIDHSITNRIAEFLGSGPRTANINESARRLGIKTEQERFQLLADEWHKVLKPKNLMSDHEHQVLSQWIQEGRYFSMGDNLVRSTIIECIPHKIEPQ